MTFVPKSHAAWNGALPLRSGVSIEKRRRGTAGLALTLGTDSYLTAARHVVGRAPRQNELVSVFHTDGSFQTSSELRHLERAAEPGAAHLLFRQDLSLLGLSAPALNVTPNGAPAYPGFGVATRGDAVWVRGARHEDWVRTIYRDDFAERHEDLFDVRGLDRGHLGVLELRPLGPAQLQEGNSGAIVWEVTPGACFALGHLVAVSYRAPLVLMVLYRSAFRALGLESARVVEKVAV